MVLQRRRKYAANPALRICMGLLSWQVTICTGRAGPGSPFLAGWRGLSKAESVPLSDEIMDPSNRRPRAFLGWRGGSSGGGDGYGPSGGDSYHYHHQPQQQQQNQQQQNQQQQQQQQQQQKTQQQQQRPQQQQQQYGQGPPPDLPPDLPDFDDGDSGYPPGHSMAQQGQSSYASSTYSSSAPQHPNQYPGSQGYQDPSMPPYPQNVGDPQQQQQHMAPPMPSYNNPNDPMMMNPDGPMVPDGDAPWDENDLGSGDSSVDLSAFDKEFILKGLSRLYKKKILPLELAYKYGHFHSAPLSPADFDAPPAVLLLGPFSVGKTSFIKYILGRDFPGIRVGPEPTTDRFTAILLGRDDKIIPGAALCAQNFRPFTGLSPFGNNFLSRMEGVELDSPILRNITLIDTPGILSGLKQRNRNYDYEAVMKWFAERADLIIIMFDAHKLDISDEMKQVIELMIPHLDKVRIVLNKADQISTQQLMRVYGALMWSLGKVMDTPEVCRVYMGSFWDKPLQHADQEELLQAEEKDLLNDIMGLPQQAVMRRINELVKRARSVKVHAYIIHYLRKQLPYNPWSKKDKQRRLIGRLESEFLGCARRYGLPKGDFPSVEPFRQALYEIKDLGEFQKLDKKLVKEMDKVFSKEIPDLLERAKQNDERQK